MKLSKKYHNAVYFARTCEIAGIYPRQMAELCTLAQRAFRAGERSCNEPDFDADPARKRFEKLASANLLRVTWPGLYPACKGNFGQPVTLAVNM